MTDNNIPYRAKEIVQGDFDKLTNYDQLRDMYYFERRLRRLLEELPCNKDAKILDFGGGSGLFSLELQKRGYSNLHLFDLSDVQCEQAKEKGLENVYCGDEDYVATRFPVKSFDFVLMCDVIEHVENPVEVLRKIGKILKPNGKLFLSYPNPLWVPALNFFGAIGLKLKGEDNKVYFSKLKKALGTDFVFPEQEGHMLVSKLPQKVLNFFEIVEKLIPWVVRKKVCILNIAILQKK